VPSRMRHTMSSLAKSRFCQACQSVCTLRQAASSVPLRVSEARERDRRP
jgi:hypothetical protein